MSQYVLKRSLRSRGRLHHDEHARRIRRRPHVDDQQIIKQRIGATGESKIQNISYLFAKLQRLAIPHGPRRIALVIAPVVWAKRIAEGFGKSPAASSLA